MEDTPHRTRVVILAAGKGTRMGADVPKVLVPLMGKPMIAHLVDAVRMSGVDARPLVVIAPETEALFRAACGADIDVVVQDPPRGTGDAARVAVEHLADRAEHMIILYGDHPLLRSESMRALAEMPSHDDAPMAMFTTTVPVAHPLEHAFVRFGRIVRHPLGALARIAEWKDATEDERAIREVNPGLYRFALPWLRTQLERLSPDNAQREYYLTDVLTLAIADGHMIPTAPLTPEESIGVNTPEEHAIAERLLTPFV